MQAEVSDGDRMATARVLEENKGGKFSAVEAAYVVDSYLQEQHFHRTLFEFRAEASPVLSVMKSAPNGVRSLSDILNEYIVLREEKISFMEQISSMESLMKSMQEFLSNYRMSFASTPSCPPVMNEPALCSPTLQNNYQPASATNTAIGVQSGPERGTMTSESVPNKRKISSSISSRGKKGQTMSDATQAGNGKKPHQAITTSGPTCLQFEAKSTPTSGSQPAKAVTPPKVLARTGRPTRTMALSRQTSYYAAPPDVKQQAPHPSFPFLTPPFSSAQKNPSQASKARIISQTCSLSSQTAPNSSLPSTPSVSTISSFLTDVKLPQGILNAGLPSKSIPPIDTSPESVKDAGASLYTPNTNRTKFVSSPDTETRQKVSATIPSVVTPNSSSARKLSEPKSLEGAGNAGLSSSDNMPNPPVTAAKSRGGVSTAALSLNTMSLTKNTLKDAKSTEGVSSGAGDVYATTEYQNPKSPQFHSHTHPSIPPQQSPSQNSSLLETTPDSSRSVQKKATPPSVQKYPERLLCQYTSSKENLAPADVYPKGQTSDDVISAGVLRATQAGIKEHMRQFQLSCVKLTAKPAANPKKSKRARPKQNDLQNPSSSSHTPSGLQSPLIFLDEEECEKSAVTLLEEHVVNKSIKSTTEARVSPEAGGEGASITGHDISSQTNASLNKHEKKLMIHPQGTLCSSVSAATNTEIRCCPSAETSFLLKSQDIICSSVETTDEVVALCLESINEQLYPDCEIEVCGSPFQEALISIDDILESMNGDCFGDLMDEVPTGQMDGREGEDLPFNCDTSRFDFNFLVSEMDVDGHLPQPSEDLFKNDSRIQGEHWSRDSLLLEQTSKIKLHLSSGSLEVQFRNEDALAGQDVIMVAAEAY